MESGGTSEGQVNRIVDNQSMFTVDNHMVCMIDFTEYCNNDSDRHWFISSLIPNRFAVASDKAPFQSKSTGIFSYFSIQTYVVDTH